MPIPDHVILVDEHDVEVGRSEKLEAHRQGVLHRAFSVFVFNGDGQMLLQKRAAGKYHSAGLTSNTCCSHPRPGEGTEEAAHRRLREEMGFDCPLIEAFSFQYAVQLTDDLSENELDHVFIGRFDGQPDPDPAEISEWRWAPVEQIARDLAERPETYTYWFRVAFEPVVEAWAALKDGPDAAGA